MHCCHRSNLSALSSIFICCLAGIGALTVVPCAAKPAKGVPKWPAIEQAVRKHFEESKGFERGDLITRAQAKPVFAKLAELGWSVPDQGAILNSLPSDGDFIVKELKTPQGKKFMRSINSHADAFDRLDRLSQLPDGQESVRTLIKGPGGHKLVDLLTSSTERPLIGEIMERSPEARDFNRATGRIYTLDAFVKRLEQSYRAGNRPASDGQSQAKPRK